MSTETINDLETELQDHAYNRSQSVARITGLHAHESDAFVRVTFELPRGETAFVRTYPNTESVWEKLYALSDDAQPPCIDTLVGASVPVEWNEKTADWALDLDLDVVSSEEQTTGETEYEHSSYASWSSYLNLLLAGSVWGVFLVAVVAEKLLAAGSTVLGGLLLVVAGLIWLAMLYKSYPYLKRFYTGQYDWAT